MPIPKDLERYVDLFQEFGLIAAGKAPHKVQKAKELEKLGLVDVSPQYKNVVELTPLGEQVLVFFLERFRDFEKLTISAALQAAVNVLSGVEDKN